MSQQLLSEANQTLLNDIIKRRTSATMSSPATRSAASAATTSQLSKHFLVGPAEGVTPKITKIDFAQTDLKEYEGMYATVIDNILTPYECRELVRLAEAQSGSKWERAMVNIGGGRQAMYEDTRKCGRIIWDEQELVGRLWERVKDLVPELHEIVGKPEITGSGPSKRREVWRMTRLNERMRFLKYTKGEYFKPHCDGMYETPDKRERTYFTLHLYLNDTDNQPGDEPLEGGATTFFGQDIRRRVDVAPKMGSILIFQQRFLIHAGDDLVRGMKLTMRTELMYQKSDELAPETEEVKMLGKRPAWIKDRRAGAS